MKNIKRKSIARERYRKLAKLRRRKKILGNRFLWLGILIFIVLVGLGVWGIFGPVFQVKEIQVLGNQEVSSEDVLGLVSREIDRKILFWPSKSIFLASAQKITENILTSFPKVEKANLKRKLPGLLIVNIKEREPIAVYCSGEDCFFIDKTGIVFKQASEYENYLVIRPVAALGAATGGDRVVEQTELDTILKIKQEVQNNLKIALKEAIISDDSLTIKTIQGWDIYFTPHHFYPKSGGGLNMGEDINWQITELKAVLEKEIPPEKREGLEYIDLRFSRVYYKYR